MAHRAGPYTQVYDKWLEEWVTAGLSGAQMAIMFKLCKNLDFHADGRATAWCSRTEMMAYLGKTEVAVKKQVARLVELGFLKPEGKAHRSKSQVYEIMPSTKWPQQRGTADGTPKKPKGYQKRSQRGTADGTPIKNTNSGAASTAAHAEEPSPDVNVQPEEAPVWRDKHTMPKWEPPKVW